jgi:hypothetical protein
MDFRARMQEYRSSGVQEYRSSGEEDRMEKSGVRIQNSEAGNLCRQLTLTLATDIDAGNVQDIFTTEARRAPS